MPRKGWNPCSLLPRRLQIVASLVVFVLLCIVIHSATVGHDDGDPSLPYVPIATRLQAGTHRLPNLFGAPAHVPTFQHGNRTQAKWFNDWSWRTPFSDTTTLDEARVVLPPQPDRPPIYTYFTWEGKPKDDKSRKAEQDLLHVWRRAWWAKGFRPIVLSNSEAIKHPLYDNVKALTLSKDLQRELMRWMAWATMGDGILCDYLAVPMASYTDDLLAWLRNGQFDSLTRFPGLDNALFVGKKADIEDAVKEVVRSTTAPTARDMQAAMSQKMALHRVVSNPIALYSLDNIRSKYPTIMNKLDEEATRADGMALLPQLINGHLHIIWQNQYSMIAALKPLPKHTTTLIEPAFELAKNLSQCPTTPIPDSCPPNVPNCRPCVSNRLDLSTPKIYRNESRTFVIGTVPHPYTITTLERGRENLDVRFVRRETDRDIWISALTKELQGTGVSSFSRLPRFKDAVASAYNTPSSLWLNAEQPVTSEDYDDLEWSFGFRIPREMQHDGRSKSPVPGADRDKDDAGDVKPTTKDLERERHLLEKAKLLMWDVADVEGGEVAQIRDITEAWNLADAEAWKFVRAFNARRALERSKWEAAEEAFLGTGRLDRWVNKIT